MFLGAKFTTLCRSSSTPCLSVWTPYQPGPTRHGPKKPIAHISAHAAHDERCGGVWCCNESHATSRLPSRCSTKSSNSRGVECESGKMRARGKRTGKDASAMRSATSAACGQDAPSGACSSAPYLYQDTGGWQLATHCFEMNGSTFIAFYLST